MYSIDIMAFLKCVDLGKEKETSISFKLLKNEHL